MIQTGVQNRQVRQLDVHEMPICKKRGVCRGVNKKVEKTNEAMNCRKEIIMSSGEKWAEIVGLHRTKAGLQEKAAEELWADIFHEIFGYSRIKGEIERQRKERIGSTERAVCDIVIKETNVDLFVVELKRPDLPFSRSAQEQLFSYLKQLKCQTGCIIGLDEFLEKREKSKDKTIKYRYIKEPIQLSDGRILVSNQWTPASINIFIEAAKGLGMEIEAVES